MRGIFSISETLAGHIVQGRCGVIDAGHPALKIGDPTAVDGPGFHIDDGEVVGS